ncbi:hypothetical protein DQP55_16730 [Mycolicibacterium sp. GF69]|nr:hypothetical protein DQP55_16730 [Mycolicibacterium sp. GF69]
MKRTRIGLATTGALAAAAIGLAAPVSAAPAEPQNAEDTIAQLKAEGYRVVVTQVGTAPLRDAEVTAVREGQSYSRIDAGAPAIGSTDHYATYQDRIVYVDVK